MFTFDSPNKVEAAETHFSFLWQARSCLGLHNNQMKGWSWRACPTSTTNYALIECMSVTHIIPPYVIFGPPDVTHAHDEWNKAFPVFRALPFHIYTECKLKNIKQGRPGNEAHHDTRVHLFTSSSIYTCRLSPTPATCDPSTPVFEIPSCTYTAEQIISILLEPIDESKVCCKRPTDIRGSATFVAVSG